MALSRTLKEAESELRRVALGYPGTYEEFPWGHRAIKVKGRAFLFMGTERDELSLSLKLPQSSVGALMLPFAAPTGYGLGKSGWITARFAGGEQVPVPILRGWLDESYRAIAPKKLIAQVQAPGDDAASEPRPPAAQGRRAIAKPRRAIAKPRRATVTRRRPAVKRGLRRTRR